MRHLHPLSLALQAALVVPAYAADIDAQLANGDAFKVSSQSGGVVRLARESRHRHPGVCLKGGRALPGAGSALRSAESARMSFRRVEPARPHRADSTVLLPIARGDPIESTPFLDSLDAPEAAEASGEGEESEGDAKAGAAEEKKPEGEAAEASGESATPEGDTNAGAAEENESEEAAPTEQG